MRGKKDSLEGISRANTRKSALKTDRSSISRFSERNKVSFADSRKTSPGYDTFFTITAILLGDKRLLFRNMFVQDIALSNVPSTFVAITN